ncbi:MAG: hypothetical protein M3071_17235, partial [Actinomycetota bacterium]|nr:hypothetical protein [Actinomycetota bacterium]
RPMDAPQQTHPGGWKNPTAIRGDRPLCLHQAILLGRTEEGSANPLRGKARRRSGAARPQRPRVARWTIDKREGSVRGICVGMIELERHAYFNKKFNW